jgi:hypothetical protein
MILHSTSPSGTSLAQLGQGQHGVSGALGLCQPDQGRVHGLDAAASGVIMGFQLWKREHDGMVHLDWAGEMNEAQAFFQAGHQREAVMRCRVLLEKALKKHYDQLLLSFSPERSIQVRTAERELHTYGYQKMGLGQLYGLFRKQKLFFEVKGLTPKQGQLLFNLPIDEHISLANRVAHEGPVELLAAQVQAMLADTQRFLEAFGLLQTQPKERYTPPEVYAEVLRALELKDQPDYLDKLSDRLGLSHQERQRLQGMLADEFRRPPLPVPALHRTLPGGVPGSVPVAPVAPAPFSTPVAAPRGAGSVAAAGPVAGWVLHPTSSYLGIRRAGSSQNVGYITAQGQLAVKSTLQGLWDAYPHLQRAGSPKGGTGYMGHLAFASRADAEAALWAWLSS